MLWLKFSLLFSFVLTSNLYAKEFNAKECLDADYATVIKHEGKFFGLLKSSLSIDKKKCILDIKFNQILKTRWLVDVCREPIHMKVTSKGSQDVYKRKGKCHQAADSDFCSFYNHLNEVIQDHGLIFAEGDRESLDTAHGQTYCAHLLLKKHLEDGRLFSLYKDPVSFDGVSSHALEKKNTPPVINSSVPQLKPMDSTQTPDVPTISPAKEDDIF